LNPHLTVLSLYTPTMVGFPLIFHLHPPFHFPTIFSRANYRQVAFFSLRPPMLSCLPISRGGFRMRALFFVNSVQCQKLFFFSFFPTDPHQRFYFDPSWAFFLPLSRGFQFFGCGVLGEFKILRLFHLVSMILCVNPFPLQAGLGTIYGLRSNFF